MMLYSIQLFLLLICLVEFGKANWECITPYKRSGVCVNVEECPPIHALWKRLQQQQQHTNLISIYQNRFLRECKCGHINDSKVCCQARTTPTPPIIADQAVYPERPKRPMKPASSSVNLPQPPNCGIPEPVTDFRIVGGRATQIYDYPWMAIIEYTLPDSGQKYFDCGGVLINPIYILTAAHCATSKATGVRLGEWDQRTDPDNQDNTFYADPVKDVPVVQVIPHEDFNTNTLANDIALLRLGESVIYTKSIKPICLPTGIGMVNINFDNIGLTVAGFGQTESDIVSSLKLYVDIEGFPQQQCKRIYRSLSLNQLCGGGLEGKDSCTGDSGGPLMYIPIKDGTNLTYLVGLVSYGPSPCGQEGQPGVYTRVSKYLSWIYNNIKP